MIERDCPKCTKLGYWGSMYFEPGNYGYHHKLGVRQTFDKFVCSDCGFEYNDSPTYEEEITEDLLNLLEDD